MFVERYIHRQNDENKARYNSHKCLQSVIIDPKKGRFVMAMKYTEEQLNQFDKATLIQLFLATQEQLESIDAKLQLVLEQLAVSNNKRFGKSSEKMAPDNQIGFMEVDWGLEDYADKIKNGASFNIPAWIGIVSQK